MGNDPGRQQRGGGAVRGRGAGRVGVGEKGSIVLQIPDLKFYSTSRFPCPLEKGHKRWARCIGKIN